MIQRVLLLATLILICCSSLFAADASSERWRISILASELASSGSAPWEEAHAGVGVGIAYAATPQWDLELTASSQSHVSPYTRALIIPQPGDTIPIAIAVTEFHRYRVMPLDLSLTRHFLAGQVLAPYVRAGVRYVDAPADLPASFVSVGQGPGTISIGEGYGFADRISTQAGAGIRLRLTPRTALRAEVDRLLRSKGTDFDPLTRYAAGVSWVF
jgi:hypothetical protein